MNLTDKEIRKALEKCAVSDCIGCPCHTRIESCLDILTPNALDLINRLQDENKALINGQETLQKTIVEQKAEIERLKADLEYYQKGCDNLCKELDVEKLKNF